MAGFSLIEKVRYYKTRMRMLDGCKQAYARGFVNGASVNHTKRHFDDERQDLSELYGELRITKNAADKQAILEGISYYKGCMQGYRAKTKRS